MQAQAQTQVQYKCPTTLKFIPPCAPQPTPQSDETMKTKVFYTDFQSDGANPQ